MVGAILRSLDDLILSAISTQSRQTFSRPFGRPGDAICIAYRVAPLGPLATGQCLVQSVSFTAVVGELVDLVEKRKPDLVCISATPPAAVMHARHLAKQVRGRFPEVPRIVELWNAPGDLNKARTRIGGDATTHVVATLAEAQEQVRLLIQPLAERCRLATAAG